MSSSAPFRAILPAACFQGETLGLTRLAANAACSLVFLAVLPAIAAWSMPRWLPSVTINSVSQAGWLGAPLRLSRAGWLALVVVPAVGGLSASALLPSVRAAYPIWRGAGHHAGAFLLSAALVAVLLLATETLYRGFALAGMHRAWGPKAVLFLLPIYVLDHIGAPTIELASSAVAGLALGALAVRTRSIWPGFVAHTTFALSVDLGSVYVSG